MRRVGYSISQMLVCALFVTGCDLDVGEICAEGNCNGCEEVQGEITIATFNIQVFGPSKAGEANVMDTLASIARQYDILCVQEIKDITGETPLHFLALINEGEGGEYAMLLSERTGIQSDDIASQEQYAYYYNTYTVRAIGDDLLFADSESDMFQREPHLARFETVPGGFTFVLVNVHTKPDPITTVEEIDALHDVVVWAKTYYNDEDDFIVVGDLNASGDYASPDALDALPIRGSEYNWIVSDDADTNLADSQCAYDRIIMTAHTQEDFTGFWGVDRSFSDEAISDHWPVWAEFHIGKETANCP